MLIFVFITLIYRLLSLYSFYAYFVCRNKNRKTYAVCGASFSTAVLTTFFKLFNQHYWIKSVYRLGLLWSTNLGNKWHMKVRNDLEKNTQAIWKKVGKPAPFSSTLVKMRNARPPSHQWNAPLVYFYVTIWAFVWR